MPMQLCNSSLALVSPAACKHSHGLETLLLLLLEYLMVVADSCPMVDMLNPSSGSTDPSFTYTIAGVDFGSNINCLLQLLVR